MIDHAAGARHRYQRGRRHLAALLAVASVTGLLYGVTSKSARTIPTRPDSLTAAGLIRHEQRVIARDELQLRELTRELHALTAQSGADRDPAVTQANTYSNPEGLTPITGAGVMVTLDDAPSDIANRSDNVNDYVVHSDDIQGVVNGFWAGGARGVTVMGRRIIGTTSVRCAGNTVLVQGQVYSPPYVITAVGEPQRLKQAVLRQTSVATYVHELVPAYGLGWKLTSAASLTLPAYEGPLGVGQNTN